MTHLERPCALVTGAARGIGRAIALALSDVGLTVVVNDPPGSTDLPETVAAIGRKGGHAKALASDICSVESHKQFVEEAWDAFGGIDCLVNNARVSVKVRDDLLKVTPESYDQIMAVNLRGPFFLTQEVAHRMIDAKSSSFRSITISSINAEFVSVDRAEYCIPRAASLWWLNSSPCGSPSMALGLTRFGRVSFGHK